MSSAREELTVNPWEAAKGNGVGLAWFGGLIYASDRQQLERAEVSLVRCWDMLLDVHDSWGDYHPMWCTHIHMYAF